MKKSFILLLSGLLLSGAAFAGYSEPTFLEARKVNNTAYNQKQAYTEIELVRFADRGVNTASIVSGDAVVYDIISADGVTIRRSMNGNSADGSFAGIACTTILTNDGAGNTIGASTTFADDAARLNWGYIVIHGPCFATAGAGGTNLNGYGDAFITSKDSGKITTFEPLGNNDVVGLRLANKNSGATGGFFMQSADGTSTTYKVFVENV